MEAWLQISEEFGLHGLSQNWGAMTLSAVISGQIFNIFYGEHLTFSSVFFSYFFFFPGSVTMQALLCQKKTYIWCRISPLYTSEAKLRREKKDRCSRNAYQLISSGKAFLLREPATLSHHPPNFAAET